LPSHEVKKKIFITPYLKTCFFKKKTLYHITKK